VIGHLDFEVRLVVETHHHILACSLLWDLPHGCLSKTEQDLSEMMSCARTYLTSSFFFSLKVDHLTASYELNITKEG
jgi:hypothetical protein